jgi:hypothetical protein
VNFEFCEVFPMFIISYGIYEEEEAYISAKIRVRIRS